MANNVDLSGPINAFKHAIYGEEVRDGLVEVAEAVQNALEQQVIEIGDIFDNPTQGTAADAYTLDRFAMLHRGYATLTDFDEGTVDQPNPMLTTIYSSRAALDAAVKATGTGNGNPPPMDLNDMTDLGFWYINSTAATLVTGDPEWRNFHYLDGENVVAIPYVANLPERASGTVVTIRRKTFNAITQLYVTLSYSHIYIRRYDGSTWSEWERLPDASTSLVLRGTLVEGEHDVDDLTRIGIWTKTGGVTITNWPSDLLGNSAGKLIVIGGTRDGASSVATYIQIIVSSNRSRIVYRYGFGTIGWSAWAELPSRTRPAITYHGDLSSIGDANLALQPGTWDFTWNSTVENWPFNGKSSGQLVTFGSSSDSAYKKLQIAADLFADSQLAFRVGSSLVSANPYDWRHSYLIGDYCYHQPNTYDSTKVYPVGDFCIYQDIVWVCTSSTTGVWNDASWEEVTSFSTTKSYTVGDICIRNGLLWSCIGSTTGTWNESKWEEIGPVPESDAGSTLYRCEQATFGTDDDPENWNSSKWSAADKYRWRPWEYLIPNNAIEQKGTSYWGRTPYAKDMHNSSDDINEFLSVAQSYYQHRYDVDQNIAISSSAFNAKPWLVHRLQYGGLAVKKISCSVFVRQVMKAITYSNSIYADDGSTPSGDDSDDPEPIDDGTLNPYVGDYEWAVLPERSYLPLRLGDIPYTYPEGLRYVQTASQLAHWMYIQGLQIVPNADWSNLEPGDILFWGRKQRTSPSTWTDPDVPEYDWYRNDGRFMAINHVAIVEKCIAPSQEDLETAMAYGDETTRNNAIIQVWKDAIIEALDDDPDHPLSAYDSTHRYMAGERCIKNDNVYVCRGNLTYNGGQYQDVGVVGEDPETTEYWNLEIKRFVSFDPVAWTEQYGNAPIHTSIEVTSNDTTTYCCVNRGWRDFGWEYPYQAADPSVGVYDPTTEYTVGDLCWYPVKEPTTEHPKGGHLYQCTADSPNVPGTSTADWTDLTNFEIVNNTRNTLVFIGRPDLGHMHSTLEDRVAALEEALANLQA